MANTLTNDGQDHIAELDAPSATTNDFDMLILSRGNDATDELDNRSAVDPADEIADSRTIVAAGYPTLGDTDTRNPGASATWWTWKFDVAAGVLGHVASNLMVTNWAGGAPALDEEILIHALLETPISKLTTEVMTVFINVEEGAVAGDSPTIYSSVDTPYVSGEAARVLTWTARARALQTYPRGVRGSANRIVARTVRGQAVWVGALLDGADGYPLRREEVLRVTLQETRVRPSDERYSRSEALEPTNVVADGPITGDPRAPVGAYNFAHQWLPPFGSTRESTWRLTYTLDLFDRTTRWFEVEVLVS
jgi:hypothetical protein